MVPLRTQKLGNEMAEQRFHQDRQLYATEGEAQTVMGSIHKTELKLYILKD